MAKKRGHGEGSIYQLDNGRWRAQFTLEGKRLSTTKKTRREVLDWLNQQKVMAEKGLTYASTTTEYGAFLTAWLENKKGELRLSTWELYKKIADAYVFPQFQSVKFKDLTAGRIQRFYDGLRERGIGVRSINFCHTILRQTLDQAEALGLVTRNPTAHVQVPRLKKKEMKIWEEDQVSAFLIAARGDPNEYLYYLACTTGMRQGELLALQWRDVDWLGKTIKVQRTVYYARDGSYDFNRPKTERGTRSVDLSDRDVTILRRQQENQALLRSAAGESWQENDLIFPGPDGRPQRGYNVSRDFSALVERAGLPEIRFHDLRHTAISLALAEGYPVPAVSQRAGHSSAFITMTTYAHAVPGRGREIADFLGEHMTPIQADISKKEEQ